MQRLKKLLLKNYQVFIISLFAISIISSRMIFAADDWATTQSVGGFFNAATNGEVNQEGWWAKSMVNTMNFVTGSLDGCDKTNDSECPDGMANGVNSLVAQAAVNISTSQPASSQEYLADIGKNLGIIPQPAYAQNGVGWEGFLPILPLWKACRNIAYLALVIIFVVIGFMIMFRKKLNPQTVISIQAAIPKLIVTLLLITFSYAIAGLIMDLTQLATRIIGNTFQETGLVAIPRSGETSADHLKTLLESNIFRLVNPLRTTGALGGMIARAGSGSSLEGKLDAWLAGTVMSAIFAIVGFFVLFKIFFALIGPYVQIVLSIVFAPIQLLLGAIPGNEKALGKWIKGLLANAAVFPVTIAMLFLVAIFKSGVYLNQVPGPGAAAPFWGMVDWSTQKTSFGITYPAPGIGNWGGAVGQVLGFGLLFTIPKVADITKALIMGKEVPGGEMGLAEIKKGLGRIPIIGKVASE